MKTNILSYTASKNYVENGTTYRIDVKIQLTDFNFQFSGYGHYRVSYTSPATGKQWSTVISDMTLIDVTKNADEPKRKDLEALKRLCKNN